jgi:hypothetical protein
MGTISLRDSPLKRAPYALDLKQIEDAVPPRQRKHASLGLSKRYCSTGTPAGT